MKASVGNCFTLLRQVDVTHSGQLVALEDRYQAVQEVMPAAFSVLWPNGVPCSLAEAYLFHQYDEGATVRDVDGGSLRATASKLSHLIRYCWDIQRDFWDLDDELFYQFIKQIAEQKRLSAPSKPCRDGNTVRAISGTSVDFLKWLQDELRFRTDLVGSGAGYRIKLRQADKRPEEMHSRSNAYVYHRLPPRDTHEPKPPMPSSYRNRLWEAVSSLTEVQRVPPAWVSTPRDRDLISEFLKSRRELELYLLEATGARPGELARLSVLDNANCYKTKTLKIPTLKRRRVIDRVIPLQPDVAMRLELFIHGLRTLLLDRIHQATGERLGEDKVFVGIFGRPMHERTMTTEFARITYIAGLSDVRSCMSMFRHRFITKQVAIHLSVYLSESGKARSLMTESDYRTILKKVAVITGHGDECSLLHYIDLAWEELGVFGRVDAARDIEGVVDSAITRIISLIGDTRRQRGPERARWSVIETLEVLRRDIQGAILRGSQ